MLKHKVTIWRQQIDCKKELILKVNVWIVPICSTILEYA